MGAREERLKKLINISLFSSIVSTHNKQEDKNWLTDYKELLDLNVIVPLTG